MADGKTNPFGNGAGGDSGTKAMPNDFSKNPGGAGNPVPTGQPAYVSNPDLSSKDAAPGGRILKADPVPNPTKDIGVGTPGNGQKPFKLDGGGA